MSEISEAGSAGESLEQAGAEPVVPSGPGNVLPRADVRDLWLTRLYFFVYMGGYGLVTPFINLYYSRRGLSGAEIGWVVAFGSIASLAFAPLWTHWGNKSGQPRRLIQFSLISSSVSIPLLGFQSGFLPISLVSSLRALVVAGLQPLSDGIALKVSGPTKAGYGSVRVWGSAGWAVLVLLSGWLIQVYGFMAVFVGHTLTMLASVVLVNLLRLDHQIKKPDPVFEQAESRAGFQETAVHLLHNPALVIIGLVLILTGLGNLGVLQFETIYMSQLGAREGLIGIAGMVSSVVEIPAMLWTDRLVKRYGAQSVLMVSLVAYIALRGLVLLIPSVSTIILQRAVGGFAFSFYTISLVQFIQENTSESDTPTALALLLVTLASLIGVFGNPLAGYAFDLIGARWLYAFAVTGYALGAIVLGFYRRKENT